MKERLAALLLINSRLCLIEIFSNKLRFFSIRSHINTSFVYF